MCLIGKDWEEDRRKQSLAAVSDTTGPRPFIQMVRDKVNEKRQQTKEGNVSMAERAEGSATKYAANDGLVGRTAFT